VYLRGFIPEDLPSVYDLACVALSERYDPVIFSDMHNHWPDGFLVISDESGIKAFILGAIMSSVQARILMLAVRDDCRRRGYGTVLFQRFNQACVQRGTRLITLEVRKTNIAALRFYRKLGFEVLDSIKSYYSDGEDAYQMQKFI